jgi:site-specific DNA-methyltransferase (adenine-specific)
MGTSLQTLSSFVPASIEAAQAALAKMEADIDAEQTYAAIRHIERAAEAIGVLYAEVEEVRRQAERTIVLAKRRCGEELAKAPKAKGGQPYQQRSTSAPKAEVAPTLKEQVGSPRRGANLKALAIIPKAEMLAMVDAIQAQGKEATASGVLKHITREKARKDRKISRAATPIPDGLDFRCGDCRTELADVLDDSAAAIITDPPWSRQAEPLYVWLAEFAGHKLIPGGSMFVFCGKGWLNSVHTIFSAHLISRWECEMRLNPSRHYPAVNVQNCSTVVLWYSKGPLRPGLTLVDDLPSPHPDKSLHEWGQGGAAVEPIIEARTKPGELIVDPFAGSGAFAFKAREMGRRVICCDLAPFGTTTIEV